MHKNEFIRQLAKETSLPQKEVSQVIKSSIELIAQTLRNGEKVVLTGFGTFEVRTRRERRGVNPQTKERITIPSTQTPGFTASNSLKMAVLGKTDPASLGSEFESGDGRIDSSERLDGVSATTTKPRGRRKAKASV
jgi:DNA-binding protein HU-beta